MKLASLVAIRALSADGPTKLTKEAVLYVHKPNVNYRCDECWMFIPTKLRCQSHGSSDVIQPYGTCGYWMRGNPAGTSPNGSISKEESGYIEHRPGYSCKRCSAYNGKDKCTRVDEKSAGDDPGEINKDGCCAAWTI